MVMCTIVVSTADSRNQSCGTNASSNKMGDILRVMGYKELQIIDCLHIYNHRVRDDPHIRRNEPTRFFFPLPDVHGDIHRGGVVRGLYVRVFAQSRMCAGTY